MTLSVNLSSSQRFEIFEQFKLKDRVAMQGG
jgi:hypothetical protein